MDSKPRESLVTAEEAATLLGVTPWRLRALAREKLVPHVRLGRQVRFSPRQLQEFIDGGGRAFENGWKRGPSDRRA